MSGGTIPDKLARSGCGEIGSQRGTGERRNVSWPAAEKLKTEEGGGINPT